MFNDLFIAPFSEFEFMRRALAGALALALGAGPIGVFLMLRRMSLVGDAMAHAILPAAAIGFLLSGLNLYAMTAGGLIAVNGTITLLVLAVIYRPVVIECVDPGFMRSVSRAGGLAHLAFLVLVVI